MLSCEITSNNFMLNDTNTHSLIDTLWTNKLSVYLVILTHHHIVCVKQIGWVLVTHVIVRVQGLLQEIRGKSNCIYNWKYDNKSFIIMKFYISGKRKITTPSTEFLTNTFIFYLIYHPPPPSPSPLRYLFSHEIPQWKF